MIMLLHNIKITLENIPVTTHRLKLLQKTQENLIDLILSFLKFHKFHV